MAMVYTYGPLYEKAKPVYQLQAEVDALNLQIDSMETQIQDLNTQNLNLSNQLAAVNEQLLPTVVDEFAADETWGAVVYALDVIKTDFAGTDTWAPSTTVLYEGEFARDTDLDFDTDDWAAITA